MKMYNRSLGRKIAENHAEKEKMKKSLKHSAQVSDFCYRVANRIKKENPQLEINPELAGFLGYVHDIGYNKRVHNHELATIEILLSEEVPIDIASMAIHGQLAEEYDDKKYLPSTLEGKILTYADMSIKLNGPIQIEERVNEIITRIRKSHRSEDEKQRKIIHTLQAMTRFKEYEKEILLLANVKSHKDFYK